MSEPTDPTAPLDGGEAPDLTEPPGPDEEAARKKRMALILGGVAAAVLIIVALVWLLSDDDGDDNVATATSTTAVVEETTTTEQAATTTTTTAETTTTTAPDEVTPLAPDDAAFVIWPAPDSDVRYDDPVAAATAFATELAGFTDPIVSEFQQGDSRSGEVEIRAIDTGPVSTVLVRQYGADDSWWVIASATSSIEVDVPQPQTAIDDPLMLSGRARAFEGTVQVSIFADGSTDPIGTGFVTGSGGEDLGPFEGQIPWTNPGGGWGTVLLYTQSAEDGSIWQVSATRVGFIGSD